MIARELAAAKEQLVRATRGHLSGVIPEVAYRVVRDEIEASVAALEEQARAAAVAGRQVPAPRLAAALLQDWDLLPVEHRRGALRDLIAHVLVTPGRPRGNVRVVPTWHG